MVRRVVAANIHLWQHSFWDAWDPLPLDKKLIWLMFVNYTVAVLTLIEFFFLR